MCGLTGAGGGGSRQDKVPCFSSEIDTSWCVLKECMQWVLHFPSIRQEPQLIGKAESFSTAFLVKTRREKECISIIINKREIGDK